MAMNPVEGYGDRAKIVVVDDDPMILRLLARVLAREKFCVLTAETGEQGLALLRTETDVGAIVTDLLMPGMDGITFLERARELQPLAVRIIVSGQGDLQATIAAINRGGASLYITKPWDEQHLVLTLREALASFGLRRENERLLATVNRQNEELKHWNFHLQQRVTEQTAQIQEQNALLQARSDRLQKITDEFRTIFNGIPDSLLLLSSDFSIIWANPGSSARFDRAADLLTGDFCYRLMHGRDEPCDDCPAVRTLAGGRTEDGMITADDGRTWGMKVFPLKDPAGRITGMIEWASDITEKIVLRAEARQASRLAALGEMAAGVAHEINNPTAVLLLNLPILRNVFADCLSRLEESEPCADFALAGVPWREMREELPDLLNDCLVSADRIRRIVEDLKDFIRSEKDGYSEWVAIGDVVDAAVRLTASTLRKATGHFRLEYGEDIPRIKGSFRRMEQVVINLLLNACQSLPNRERGIVVATRFDAESQAVLLEICDEGIGIAAENLPRIREPFFTTRREQGGTGLGLSVSSRIIEEHGGRLEFFSRPGEGTRAVISLPAGAEVQA